MTRNPNDDITGSMGNYKTSFKMYEGIRSLQIKGHKCGSRGGTGGPDPPGKSQVIWVSIRNKQLDPPPGKSWTPLPWKMLDPLRNLEKMIDFFEIDYLTSVK